MSAISKLAVYISSNKQHLSCLLLLPVLLAGCTSTSVKVGDIEVSRTSVMQKINVVAGFDVYQKPFIIYYNDGAEGAAILAGKITEGAVRGLK